jgi:D-glycero-alpha-D-manno-heptose-7-phosphate kinase
MPAGPPASSRTAARTWCRVDLAGGTLDIWPLGLLHRGACTVNVAVDVAARVELLRRPSGYRVVAAGEVVDAGSTDELARHPSAALAGLVAAHLGLPPVEIRLESDSPRGGGLGASSALVVAAIAAGEALLGLESSGPERTSALARDLEAVLMGLPTGAQDHYPAILGGALELRHLPGGRELRRLEVDLDALGRHLVVAFTGSSHFSAGTNWQVIRRRLEGDRETVRCFAGIAAAAAAIGGALESGELERVGKLMEEEWSYRRRLAAEVSTPRIEELLTAAARAGAWGGKACGAGGGGCIAVLAPESARAAVAAALASAGATVLAARPTAVPLQVHAARDL